MIIIVISYKLQFLLQVKYGLHKETSFQSLSLLSLCVCVCVCIQKKRLCEWQENNNFFACYMNQIKDLLEKFVLKNSTKNIVCLYLAAISGVNAHYIALVMYNAPVCHNHDNIKYNNKRRRKMSKILVFMTEFCNNSSLSVFFSFLFSGGYVCVYNNLIL